jgi:hypothetical protein
MSQKFRRNLRGTTVVKRLDAQVVLMKKLSLKSLLEWHRWFAWYPVPVVRKGKLRYAWLRFVERKGGKQIQRHNEMALSPPCALTNAIEQCRCRPAACRRPGRNEL